MAKTQMDLSACLQMVQKTNDYKEFNLNIELISLKDKPEENLIEAKLISLILIKEFHAAKLYYKSIVKDEKLKAIFGHFDKLIECYVNKNYQNMPQIIQMFKNPAYQAILSEWHTKNIYSHLQNSYLNLKEESFAKFGIVKPVEQILKDLNAKKEGGYIILNQQEKVKANTKSPEEMIAHIVENIKHIEA